MTIVDIRPPEDVERLISNLAQPRQPLERSEGWRHLLKDGTVIHVEITSHTIETDGQESALVIAQDISERKQAEEQLERSNQRLNEILVSIQDDFYVLDRDWNFAYASRLFTSKLGKEPEDFVGSNIWEMFPKHVGTVLEENFRAAMEKREIRRFEIGGKYTAAWYRMTVLPSAEGITVIGTDITEHKQTEEALHLKDELLRLTSEMAKVGGWEFDPETGKGAWTDEVARIHDLDPAQETNVEIGLSFYEGTSRAKVEQAVQEAIELGKPYDLELEMVTAKGNHKWVRTIALPITNDGRVVKVQGIFQDITERKQAQAALQEAHDELELKVQERTAALSEANSLLQALMDYMPDQIYFKDMQSRFIRNSRAQASLLGLSDPVEVIGKTDFDFFPHAAKAYAEEQEIMRSGKPMVDFEEWVVWPDGRETWVSTTKVPLRNSDGETIGIFGISRDITERKRAEQSIRQLNSDLEKQAAQLQAANKELEAFAYSVSHDLRAPLRAIDGYTRILVEDYEANLDAEGKRVCGVISGEARRMGQLIDDLLAFSRLGRKEIYSSNIDMKALVVSVLNELLKDEDRARIDFHIARLPSTSADSSLMRQVWVNLISNSIKFTSKKERATIEVGGKSDKDEIIYYVRDSGAGFDMEYSNKLFGVFQRLHGESEFEGTGVGLAIVQRIIRRHGGRVWAEGEVDKGATFYFALPRKENHHE
jgi:PAS domain S-box-containing protein